MISDDKYLDSDTDIFTSLFLNIRGGDDDLPAAGETSRTPERPRPG